MARTFYSVSEKISPTRIIRLSLNYSPDDGYFFEIVNYGSVKVGRRINCKEVASIFANANQGLRLWIMKKTGRDAVSIMAALKA